MYSEVQTEEIRDLYEEFLGNHAGELVVVGNFDPESLRTTLARGLEPWTSDQPYVRMDNPPNTDREGTVDRIETPDKSNALLYSSQQFAVTDTSPERADMVMANFILGGGSLASRLADRVRQQEGLSYGIRSGLTTRARDERVDLTLYAITAPQNVDRLLEVIAEEYERIRTEGVTAEELAAAQDAYLQAERLRRSDDRALIGLMINAMMNDRTLEVAAQNEQRIRETTVKSVNQAVKKYFNMDDLVIAVAGDFAGTPDDTKDAAGTQPPED